MWGIQSLPRMELLQMENCGFYNGVFFENQLRLPPFSLIHDFGKQRARSIRPKIPVWISEISICRMERYFPPGRTDLVLLAVPPLCRELGRVSNFKNSINWHQHMKDHVEIVHLTKYDAFRVNRDKLWTLKYGSKSIQTSLILRQRPPTPYKLLKFSINFMTTVKSRTFPIGLSH